jgi:hypothetical protein
MKDRIGVAILAIVLNFAMLGLLFLAGVLDYLNRWNIVKLFFIAYIVWGGFCLLLYEWNLWNKRQQ